MNATRSHAYLAREAACVEGCLASQGVSVRLWGCDGAVTAPPTSGGGPSLLPLPSAHTGSPAMALAALGLKGGIPVSAMCVPGLPTILKVNLRIL